MNNPQVGILGAGFEQVKLQLAVNTAQYGRTFQDRSHSFTLHKRPAEMASQQNLKLLTVGGKRGMFFYVSIKLLSTKRSRGSQKSGVWCLKRTCCSGFFLCGGGGRFSPIFSPFFYFPYFFCFLVCFFIEHLESIVFFFSRESREPFWVGKGGVDRGCRGCMRKGGVNRASKRSHAKKGV